VTETAFPMGALPSLGVPLQGGEGTKNKLSMIVFSGEMDKVFAAYVVATGAAASGMEVVMFHTFWGLNAIQRGNLTGAGKGILQRMLGLMNRGGLKVIGPSRFNFGGIGRWMLQRMMRSKGVASLEELQQAATALGVRILPCQMSMEVMGICSGDCIPEAEAPVGVATFIAHAAESKITLFI
jgi:peroxiredoxin family protein